MRDASLLMTKRVLRTTWGQKENGWTSSQNVSDIISLGEKGGSGNTGAQIGRIHGPSELHGLRVGGR